VVSKLASPVSSRLAPAASIVSRVKLDDSRRPISIYTFDGEFTAPDFHRMLKHSEELLRRGRHALLMDMRRLQAMSALLRQQAAEWNIVNTVNLARLRVGLAMVITDRRERGIVTAIYWHKPPPYPYLICESLEEALEWCRQKLAR
jgi:uncharacterized protein (DUF1786 family)